MFILFGSVILLLGINSKIIIYIKSASLEKKISAASKHSPHRNVSSMEGGIIPLFFFFLLTAVTPVIKQNQA